MAAQSFFSASTLFSKSVSNDRTSASADLAAEVGRGALGAGGRDDFSSGTGGSSCSTQSSRHASFVLVDIEQRSGAIDREAGQGIAIAQLHLDGTA